MKASATDIASTVLAVCALVITGIVVKREFTPQRPREAPAPGFREFSSPHDLTLGGHSLGSQRAPVTIVEFADFQCPYCGREERVLHQVRALYGDSVRILYRHFPLEAIHPKARAAALASECAAAQNHFESMHDLLFALQDSMGSIPFVEFARRAKVPALETFTKCMTDARGEALVDADLQVAEELELSGTPTFIMGNRMYEGVPSLDEWKAAIDKEIAKNR